MSAPLTADQQKALTELKSLASAVEGTDEHELLRFLRARKFDPKAALQQLVKYKAWRKENKVDELLNKPLPRQDVVKKLISANYHGFDKQGRPVYIEKTGAIPPKAVVAYLTDNELITGHIWGQEYQIQRCAEQSQKLGKHIDSWTVIMDLKGLGWSHKELMKFTQIISQIDQDYYPERLGQMFIVNPPWIFNALFAIVKPWLDPATKAKIHVLGSDFKAKLLQHIDAEQLPAEYGGSCNTCTEGCMPVTDVKQFQEDLKKSEEGLELKTHTIGARKTFQLKLRGGDQAVFSWFFKTTSHDVSFGVDFEADSGEKICVTKPARVEAHKNPIQSSWACKGSGMVVLTWDNSHSWFTSNPLNYFLGVAEAGKIEDDQKAVEGEGDASAAAAAAATAPAAAAAGGEEDVSKPMGSLSM